MNEDPEPEPEPPKEEKPKMTAEDMLEVIKPFTQTGVSKVGCLAEALGLIPSGGGDTETVTEEVAEEEAQVELLRGCGRSLAMAQLSVAKSPKRRRRSCLKAMPHLMVKSAIE